MFRTVRSLCFAPIFIALFGGIVGCAGGPQYQLERWLEWWPKNSYETTISYIDRGYIRIVNGESKFPDFHPDMRNGGHTNDALCVAILDGLTNNVRALLDRGANPNRTCDDGGKLLSALDEAMIWGAPEMQQIIRLKGGMLLDPEIRNPATRDQEIARLRKKELDQRERILTSARILIKQYHDEEERRLANERASRNDILGKVVVGVGIAAMTSQASISDEAKVQIMSATAQDLASNGEGKATATLSNSPVLNRQPSTNSGAPQRQVTPSQAASASPVTPARTAPTLPTTSSVNTPSSSTPKTRRWIREDWSIATRGKTDAEACDAAERQYSSNTWAKPYGFQKLINRGACTCEQAKDFGALSTYSSCKISLKMEVETADYSGSDSGPVSNSRR